MAESAPATPCDLSVVIPAFNEGQRIRDTLKRTVAHLGRRFSYELIVVDDGSRDDTAGVVESFEDACLLKQPCNRGKGAAVRRGVLAARGKRVLFMDADLSTPIEEVDKLIDLAADADVVIGSRRLPSSNILGEQPLHRRLLGSCFSALVRALLLGDFSDTQCGFKLFGRDAAEAIFSQQRLDGFAFDVEVLMLAEQLGYVIKEVPVAWQHSDDSKISPVLDSASMFRDLVRLKTRQLLAARTT